jgi:hypothetical protein
MAAWAPLALVGGLVVLAALAVLVQRAGGAKVRRVGVWTCGEEEPVDWVRYPASSFYQPLKQAFRGVYPTFTLRPPAFPVWLRRAFDVDAWFYLPLAREIEHAARSVSRTHVGVPQVYLLWIVAGAVVVMGMLLALGALR